MGKRFGRNQKRQYRDTVANLEMQLIEQEREFRARLMRAASNSHNNIVLGQIEQQSLEVMMRELARDYGAANAQEILRFMHQGKPDMAAAPISARFKDREFQYITLEIPPMSLTKTIQKF